MAKAAVVQKEVISLPNVAIRRFGTADLASTGRWLIYRLQEKFPSLSDSNIAGWVRGEVDSNESLFRISDVPAGHIQNAVGLFKIRMAPMEPRPMVEEVFVLVRNDAWADGAAIYREAKRWGESMNASGLIVDRFTDVPTEIIAKAIGLIYDSRISVVKL